MDLGHYILGGSVRNAMYHLIFMTMNVYNDLHTAALTAGQIKQHETWESIKHPTIWRTECSHLGKVSIVATPGVSSARGLINSQ